MNQETLFLSNRFEPVKQESTLIDSMTHLLVNSLISEPRNTFVMFRITDQEPVDSLFLCQSPVMA